MVLVHLYSFSLFIIFIFPFILPDFDFLLTSVSKRGSSSPGSTAKNLQALLPD